MNKRETPSERKTFLDVARCLLTFTLTTPIPVRELRVKPPGDFSNSLSYGFKAVRVLHIYQGMLSNPHQLITKIIIALLWNIIYLQCFTRSTVISRQVLKDGLLSLDSQTAMARVGSNLPFKDLFGTIEIEQGTTVTLCCVATGSPRPRVEWSRHQRSTLLSPRFFQEEGCLAVNTAKEYGEPVEPQTALG